MDNALLLVQTDTTVGFCSRSAARIDRAKQRPSHKPYLQTLSSFTALKQRVRVPHHHLNRVRRSKRCTFVMKNRAFRVITSHPYTRTINRFGGTLFSSSANLSGSCYDETFAKTHADIIIEADEALHESCPSRIVQLSTSSMRRLR